MAKPIYIYTGTEWVPVGPQIGNIAYNWIYTATGSETSLSGTDDNGLTLSYTPNYEQVYLNGVLLTRGTDYTAASSSSITGLSALTNGDVINVLVLETTTVDNTYTQNQTDVLLNDKADVDNTYTQNQVDVLLNDKADLASPALTGTPTAPTATQWDASTQIATTEFVNNQTVAINQFGAAGSSLLNLPSQVHPAEKLLKQAVWYIDSAHESAGNQEISNLGWGGNVLNAQSGSATGADSNDPKFLDWEGENYLYCAGDGDNHVSVAHSTEIAITGDIDLRIHVAMDDYNPVDFPNSHILINKGTTNDTYNYRFMLRNPSNLEFRFGTGSNSYAVTSDATISPLVSDGEPIWFRATHDPSVGEVKFYYGFDGSAWTQLGTTQSITAATPTTTSDPFQAMGLTTVSNAGKFYRAQVLDGIDGTPVLDVDTSMIDSGSDTSFPALTGQTVTINRSTSGRKSVAVTHPCWLFGTDDYMEVADNDLIDMGTATDFTVLTIIRQWNTPANFGRYIDKIDGSTYANGWALYLQGTVLNTRFVLTGTVASNGPAFTEGAVSAIGLVVDRDSATATLFSGSTSGTPQDISGMGTFDNALPLRVGRANASSAYQDFEFIAAAVFRKALTAGEIATLTNYFNGRTGG